MSSAKLHGESITNGTVRRITQSEMTTFMRCPRKWDLAYGQNLTPKTQSSKLVTGTLVHKALADHYTYSDSMGVFNAITPEEETDESILARIMVEGYLEWLEETGIDAGHTVLLCEHTLEAELFPGVNVVGTVDLVTRDQGGLIWLWDHKTVAAFAGLADRRLQLNFQLLTYAWLLKQNGFQVHGAMLNMLRKVKRTASAKPPFYLREDVYFNDAQLLAHQQHMDEVAIRIKYVENELAGTYPVVDQDCTWKCPFMPVCAMLDEHPQGAREMLNELYVRREANA